MKNEVVVDIELVLKQNSSPGKGSLAGCALPPNPRVMV